MSSRGIENGFTLIELMVTVAIIGILASVAYPSYLDSIQKSRRVDASNGLLECANRQERNYTKENTYLADGEIQCVSADKYYNISVDLTLAIPGCQATVQGNNRFNCFILTATPQAGNSQASDSACQILTLTHTGAREAKDTGGNVSTSQCWKV